MRNLEVVSYSENLLENGLPLTSTVWNAAGDSIICGFGPTVDQPRIELKSRKKPDFEEDLHCCDSDGFVLIASWDAPCPLSDLPCDEILLMQHFSDTASICVVLAGGDLILVRQEPQPDQEEVEIVGSIEAGICAATWAPDEEVLAIVTRDDQLVLMSRHLDPLTETKLTSKDLNLSRNVSVGWGKKETQFQGKRVKAMRDPTMPEYVEEGQPSKLENHKTSISWRGDGAYLAINAVVPNHRRAIRVFSREGQLDSVSEPVDGLESALSWRPSGNLIASLRRTTANTDGDKLEVIFFERNGLRHGEFELRLNESDAENKARSTCLTWNSESSVLAVAFRDSVQFWTTGNYHYYLKQDFKAADMNSSPISVLWHPRNALKCCLSGSRKASVITFEHRVCRGSLVQPFDHGIVAVIDGNILKLTPFKQAGVPPPMAFCELRASDNIQSCAISRNGQLIALLTSSTLEISDWKLQNPANLNSIQQAQHCTSSESLVIPLQEFHEFFRQRGGHLYFVGNNELFILAQATAKHPAQCFRINLTTIKSNPRTKAAILEATQSINVAPSVTSLVSDPNQEVVWARLHASRTLTCLSSAGIDLNLPSKQGRSTVYTLQKPASTTQSHIIQFTPDRVLRVDDVFLANDCTSHAVTDQYLVFTTSQHLLKFVHLDHPEIMEVPADTPETDERCRAIERGAEIVTIVPSTYAVILQMPRGNLETIYPRVLVLSGIRKCLELRQYRAAFKACQNHQVDMNLLCDYLPSQFMANVQHFIEDLKKSSRIDEFISKLKEDDVTQTLYQDTSRKLDSLSIADSGVLDRADKNTFAFESGTVKVNRICDAIINVLNTKGPKFLQNLITAHVSKRPPDLVAALTLVSSLRSVSPEDADVAVSHLCFLTDNNRLYDTALALYDLDLALLVAQNSQRDPREYMPFLRNLQSLPSLRRQYQIDNHLRRYSQAILSLYSIGVHEEVEAYMVRHKLYTTAMSLYKYDAKYLPRITTLYAEHLESQSKNAAAAILYESLGQHLKAYPLYALAHQWRESLSCAILVPLEDMQLRTLAVSLASTLNEESRDYRAAAQIHIDYLSDVLTAARLLCKGSYFAEATRILSRHSFATEITSIVDSGLSDKFSEILELVSDCKSQLQAQVPRIQELRVKKAEDPLAFYGGDAAAIATDGNDIPDNISLAPSDTSTIGGQSLYTRYGSNTSRFGGTVASNVSRKTSKTKRREERKRARGKKGSVYEEEYLVASVGRLIDRVNGIHDEVRRLVFGLLRRGMREQAAQVEQVMADVTIACETSIKKVWQVSEESRVSGISGTVVDGTDVRGRPTGADRVVWDSQQETARTAIRNAPVVKVWSGSPLILE